jgi:hypothetical protein
VIVRFFSTETRHLELLLSAIEAGGQGNAPDYTGQSTELQEPSAVQDQAADPDAWEWEERYITLLWLSQLLLAPFDLSSISSEDSERITSPEIAGFEWPANTPGLTMRVIPLAIHYLSSSGKERDSAKVLLVRVAMRRDMQELGIFRALVRWSMTSMRTPSSHQSTYYYIGILSFMAGLLNSSVGTTHMDPYLSTVLQIMGAIWEEHLPDDFRCAIKASVVARKVMIKILREVSAIALQRPEDESSQDILQDTVPILLDMLSDAATPVRLAASKALSVIVLKLDSDMASQLVEAILSSFQQNVLTIRDSISKEQDLSRVDPNEWHGLIMTLSHLLYRRSIPAKDLPPILEALRRGLSFEKKTSAGASMGTNVRDAANFGIWALARRYSTAELEGLTMEPHDYSWDDREARQTSALQTLATELVIAASLDPAGNIRRGSSAALQELIGRHPNKIENGIAVVQVVDYHAVARRSRAIEEVASQAAGLSQQYRAGLLTGLMGWRGVKDTDDPARRSAASAVANIMWGAGPSSSIHNFYFTLSHNVDILKERLDVLAPRDVEGRHGLILSLAEVFALLNPACFTCSGKICLGHSQIPSRSPHGLIQLIRRLKLLIEDVLKRLMTSGRRPDLVAEAGSKFILKGIPFSVNENIPSGSGHSSFTVDDIQALYDNDRPPTPLIIDRAEEIVALFLEGSYAVSMDILHTVAATVLLYLPLSRRRRLSLQWIASAVSENAPNSIAYINTLLKLFNTETGIPELQNSLVVQTFHLCWNTRKSKSDLDRREAILKGLSKCRLSRTSGRGFIDIINEGLNDYTTNARGDVGSNVRIAAAQVASTFMVIPTSDRVESFHSEDEAMSSLEQSLFGKILRIAAEKLDKVRVEGQKALVCALKEHLSISQSAIPEASRTKEQQWEFDELEKRIQSFEKTSCSDRSYFRFLLELQNSRWWKTSSAAQEYSLELMSGYVTSADMGSEDLVRASRAELVGYCVKEGQDVPLGEQHSITSTKYSNLPGVATTLFELLKRKIGDTDDRYLAPTLEIIAFLLDMHLLQKSSLISWPALNSLVKKAHYRTSSIRRLEASIKIYGSLIPLLSGGAAVLSLVSFLSHRYPRIVKAAVDELWVGLDGDQRAKNLKRVDWTKVGKDKARIAELKVVLIG